MSWLGGVTADLVVPATDAQGCTLDDWGGVDATGEIGADGVKTDEEVELFGGTAGIIYDPNYHTPEDDITNVDVEALEIMSKAIAHATITLAYDTSAINGKTAPAKSGCAGKSCDRPDAGQGLGMAAT